MKLKTLMMTAAASALIAGGAIAQDTTATTDVDVTTADVAPAVPQFTSISEMTVGDIVGQNVYEPNGEKIGDIDYIIGADGGADAVIGIGGFLGLGEYTVALPLEEFTYDAEQQMVKLDTTKDALKEQPEFDESGAESLPDETALASLMESEEAPAADDGAMNSGDASIDEETMTEDDSAKMEAEQSDQAVVPDDAAVEGDADVEADAAVEADTEVEGSDAEMTDDAAADADAAEGEMDEETKAE